jgi:hypothetical protein
MAGESPGEVGKADRFRLKVRNKGAFPLNIIYMVLVGSSIFIRGSL